MNCLNDICGLGANEEPGLEEDEEDDEEEEGGGKFYFRSSFLPVV